MWWHYWGSHFKRSSDGKQNFKKLDSFWHFVKFWVNYIKKSYIKQVRAQGRGFKDFWGKYTHIWDELPLMNQISMHILSSAHSLTLSLSRIFQKENLDVGEAIELASATKVILIERSGNDWEEYSKIFKTMSNICD